MEGRKRNYIALLRQNAKQGTRNKKKMAEGNQRGRGKRTTKDKWEEQIFSSSVAKHSVENSPTFGLLFIRIREEVA